MRPIVWIFSLTLLLWGGANCQNKMEITKKNGYYYIHVYDDKDEDDLSLEAKALLYYYIKKQNHLKENFTLEMSHFQNMQSYQCQDTIHEIYRVPIASIHIIQPARPEENYRDIRKKIYYEIAQIETKEQLSLEDLKRLYRLYLSLGKIRQSNKIMEQIMKKEFEGM